MTEISTEKPVVDPLTVAYDRQLNEIFALGLNEYNQNIFKWLGRDESDAVRWAEGRAIFRGLSIDRISTRASGRVVYEQARGYWCLEVEIGSSDYDAVVFDSVVELCETLRERRYNMIFRKGENHV